MTHLGGDGVAVRDRERAVDGDVQLGDETVSEPACLHGMNRRDTPRRARGLLDTVDDGRIDEGTGCIVDQHVARRPVGQAFQAQSDGILPRRAAMDRRTTMKRVAEVVLETLDTPDE